jgi:hypothetical protein
MLVHGLATADWTTAMIPASNTKSNIAALFLGQRYELVELSVDRDKISH